MALDTSTLIRKLTATPKVIAAAVTRPNDTSAYVAGDVIANATSSATQMSFTGVAAANGGAFLLNRISVHFSGNPTNKLDFYFQLMDTALATAPNDNAALVLTNAENKTLIYGVFVPGQTSPINVSVGNTGISGEQVLYVDNLGALLVCAAGSTSLWALLSVANASGYTPIASEEFHIKLYGEQLA